MKTIIEDIIIDSDSKSVYKDKVRVPMTKNEYMLLSYLAENEGKVYSRKELINTLWENEVAERTVDNLVSRIKIKIGPIIKPVNGYGYGIIKDIIE